MKNSKKIILSVALLSALNAFGATNTVNPLSPSFKALDNGGSLDAIDAYQDGVGVFVITGDNTIVINNSPMNTLVFKYGEAAKENGVPLVEQVQVDGTLTDKELASIILENVPNGTACNDNNALTENDVYTNGVCAGTPIQSCATGFSGDKTTNLSCATKGLANIDNWSGLTSTTASIYLNGNSLTNVNGLSSLTSVGSWIYLNNNALTNVDGLSHLVSTGSGLNLTYNSLTNVDGLRSLTSIGGNLYLYNNNLTNLNGLSSLTSVGGTIDIYNNPNLQNLSGLNNVVMNAGSIIRFDSRAYTNKMSATAPICIALKAGTLSRSGATVAQVCN